MKTSLLLIPLAVITVTGMLLYLGEAEPQTGRYQEARKVVNEVKSEILGFHSQLNTLPKDLTFIQDPELKKSISTYNVTFDPTTKEIKSSDNWTYYPDRLHRITFGILGDERGRSVGDPGFNLEYEIPGEVSIAE